MNTEFTENHGVAQRKKTVTTMFKAISTLDWSLKVSTDAVTVKGYAKRLRQAKTLR